MLVLISPISYEEAPRGDCGARNGTVALSM